MGFGKATLNGNLLDEAFGFAKNGREIALEIMPMEMWELGFQLAVGFSPYDIAYDAASLLAGKDIVTGGDLTDFDRAVLVLGVFTGIGDELVKIGKKVRGFVGSNLDVVEDSKNVIRSLRKSFDNKGFIGAFADIFNRFKRKLNNLFGEGDDVPHSIRQVIQTQ